MHEVNKLFPLRLAKFFLIQQLIYQSKIEKHNFSSNIFVSDTSMVRNLHLIQLEKIFFGLHKDPCSFFGSDFGICLS